MISTVGGNALTGSIIGWHILACLVSQVVRCSERLIEAEGADCCRLRSNAAVECHAGRRAGCLFVADLRVSNAKSELRQCCVGGVGDSLNGADLSFQVVRGLGESLLEKGIRV